MLAGRALCRDADKGLREVGSMKEEAGDSEGIPFDSPIDLRLVEELSCLEIIPVLSLSGEVLCVATNRRNAWI